MDEKSVNLKKEILGIITRSFKDRRISLGKIVLFGSFARNRQGEQSDIDLIIVSRDFRGKSLFKRVELTTGINLELVRKTRKPFELLYYSDLEWKKGDSVIISAAKSEGEIIYG